VTLPTDALYLYGYQTGSADLVTWNVGRTPDGPLRRCGGIEATIFGSFGDDTIADTPGPDVIVALHGDDVVNGMGGADLICLGPGAVGQGRM
jgi:RTX calcium-binding nonapeptide repeat (4 copies)